MEGLPSHTFRTDDGDVALKCPTEIAITDRREKELADQGLVPLVHCKGTDKAAFFSIQSCNKPKIYDSDAATANARLSAQLPYMMATCRFAHYLKSMMRDKVGSFLSRDDCWRFLNRWISQYVTQDDNADQATKAAISLAGSACGRRGDQRQAGLLPGDQLSSPALSIGRDQCFSPAGSGLAGAGEEVTLSFSSDGIFGTLRLCR